MNILVTGATGYIASRLIPQLLERGHKVRALARKPHLLRPRAWSSKIDIAQADAMDPASLAPAMKDIHTAYYLIHNMSSGHGYTELEQQAARNFAKAAEEAGIQHIIYLGGLADPEQHIAPHMRSRIETGATLRQGSVPVTEFRAGVIAGSGSISFEMIRFMTELFPIIPGPRWLKHKSQPISTQNVVDYLLAALDNWGGHGQVFEIGGPEIASYQDLMLKYANARGLKRRFFLLPYVPIWFMAFGIDLMTPVPYPIAYALVGGLSADSVVVHGEAHKTFPEIKLMDFESAAGHALKRLHPNEIERVWESAPGKFIKHEGFFIDHRRIELKSSAEKVFRTLQNVEKDGWPFANWMWVLRGWLDRLAGGRANAPYQVETSEPNRSLLLHSQLKAPGEGWMEWRVEEGHLTQTAFFAPHGLGGFLYWYLLYPFHVYLFRGTIRALGGYDKSEKSTF